MAQDDADAEPIRQDQLTNGWTCSLWPDRIVVTDVLGRELAAVRMDEVVDVRRGGADIIVMRAQHDPLSLRFTRLDEARDMERELNLVSSAEDQTRASRPWWRFWTRG